MSTDPAPETDRELLDRLLPGWVISGVGVVTGFYVQHMDYLGPLAGNGDLATTAAASALRAILARDRETRVEAEPETPRLRRVPVQMATVVSGNEIYVVTLANDGTMWETDFPMHECKWCRGSPLPQPGEDGGE